MSVSLAALLFMLFMNTVAFGGQVSRLEEGVMEEMNQARRDPKGYVKLLKEHRKQYQGKLFVSDKGTRYATTEGTKAVDEAIRFMERQTPLPPLAHSPGLARAAGALVTDQGPAGTIGHAGPTSGGTRKRIDQQGKWEATIGENISYGYSDPRLVVMQLIVDDGVPKRAHRENIFDPAYKVAGVACGPHKKLGTMCVISYAGGFTP